MARLSHSLYAGWRASNPAFPVLREGQESAPPERLLQAVWSHQRLRRDQLVTFDGQKLRVLHPGFKNREAGPDFRQAVLQFGSETPRSGDVEIDLHAASWRGHGHDRNPNYKNVILHIVWGRAEKNPTALPTLALENVLDSPLDELARWLGSEAEEQFPLSLAGQCSAPLRDLGTPQIAELLSQAALIRLQRKAAGLQARARDAGWENALWEGIFRALGYKQNSWPFLRLAESLPELRDPGLPALTWQARLLGVAGLLPSQAPPGAEKYLRQVWDMWWRERERFSSLILPKSVWRFNGLRPANHPQRRLALASHWLASGDLFAHLEKWFTEGTDDPAPGHSLLEACRTPPDAFWSWHWTLRSARLARPQPLLGLTRMSDLAMNVLLPWFWIRAVAGKNETLKNRAETLYFSWPPAGDNATLRLARQRLLGAGGEKIPRTAAAQQGLLQIVTDFCRHSNAVCAQCQFPDLVRQASTPDIS